MKPYISKTDSPETLSVNLTEADFSRILGFLQRGPEFVAESLATGAMLLAAAPPAPRAPEVQEVFDKLSRATELLLIAGEAFVTYGNDTNPGEILANLVQEVEGDYVAVATAVFGKGPAALGFEIVTGQKMPESLPSVPSAANVQSGSVSAVASPGLVDNDGPDRDADLDDDFAREFGDWLQEGGCGCGGHAEDEDATNGGDVVAPDATNGGDAVA